MKLSQDQLSALIETAKQQVEIGAKYRHYKSEEMSQTPPVEPVACRLGLPKRQWLPRRVR